MKRSLHSALQPHGPLPPARYNMRTRVAAILVVVGALLIAGAAYWPALQRAMSGTAATDTDASGTALPPVSAYLDVEDYAVPGDDGMHVSGTKVPYGLRTAHQPQGMTPFETHPQFRAMSYQHVLSVTMHSPRPDPTQPMRLAIRLDDLPSDGWLVLAQNVTSPLRENVWRIRTDVNVIGGKMYFSSGELGAFKPLWINIPKGDVAALRQLERSIVAPLDLVEGSWSNRTGETETLTIRPDGSANFSHHFQKVQCGEKLGRCVLSATMSIRTEADGALTATFVDIEYLDVLSAGVPTSGDAPASVLGLPEPGTVTNLVVTMDDRLVMRYADGRKVEFCNRADYSGLCQVVE